MTERWDEKDLIYLAGFLDGEGCFTISQNQIRLCCVNTYKPIMEWLKTTFGGNYYHSKSYNVRHRDKYEWRLSGLKLFILVKYLLPFLKEKQLQASVQCTYFQLPKFQGVRGGVPTIVQDERLRLEKLIKGMKFVSY